MATARKAAFSSTAATLKWARSVWGDEAVTIASWWQAHGASEEPAAGGLPGLRPRRKVFGVRKDLWNFQDVQVLDGLPGVLALQACGQDVGEHQRKLAGHVRRDVSGERRLKAEIDAAKLAGRVRRWLAAGNRLLLVAWRELWVDTSERTKRKQRRPRFIEARLEPHPPGATLGLSDREVIWIAHDTWPPRAKETP